MENSLIDPVSGPNPLCPERMSSAARLAEIGRILAAGVLRLKATQSSDLFSSGGDSFVDFSPRKSGGRRTKPIRIGGNHEASQ
jgi:hypothetical protein